MKARGNEGRRGEPFHKIRITACRTTGERNGREGGSGGDAFQSHCMRRVVRWWKKKKCFAGPFKSRGPSAACEEAELMAVLWKKDGQASPKFDHRRIAGRRWSCRWSDKDESDVAATSGGRRRHRSTGGKKKREKINRWKFVVRATWRPNWYNNKNGAFRRVAAPVNSRLNANASRAATLQRVYPNLREKPIRVFRRR